MAFEKTASGTRGSRAGSFGGPVGRWLNGQMIRRSRRKGGRMMGMDTLVLTTIGAKTGQRRETLLGTFADGDDAWLIVASAGGAARNPAWYHNLAAHPDQAEVEVGGRKAKVTATQLTGAERDAAWQRITAAQPRYAGYTTKTDREIPVIRLTTSPAPPAPPA
jgi:deazaflavin-dependent oxidoreductase (nitroreductase family)